MNKVKTLLKEEGILGNDVKMVDSEVGDPNTFIVRLLELIQLAQNNGACEQPLVHMTDNHGEYVERYIKKVFFSYEDKKIHVLI